MPTTAACIDVREIDPPSRHPLIMRTFDAMPVGDAFEILSDHDPLPLYFQFDRTRPGQFDWLYLEAGPEQWHVRVARLAEGPAGEPEAGCGGGGHCQCRGAPNA